MSKEVCVISVCAAMTGVEAGRHDPLQDLVEERHVFVQFVCLDDDALISTTSTLQIDNILNVLNVLNVLNIFC